MSAPMTIRIGPNSVNKDAPQFKGSKEKFMLAEKTGDRHTVFQMRPNKQYYIDKKLNNHTGEFSHLPGSKYKGQWLDNKKSGFGTETLKNGNVYEGEFVEDDREGKGTYYTYSPALGLRKSYTGDWKKGKPHGLGVQTSAEGERYSGGWEAGKRSGHGQQLYADGRVYEGGWREGMKEGRGVLRMKNGDVYVGNFKEDKKEGPGRYIYRETRKVYEGEWEKDTARCGEFRPITKEECLEISLDPSQPSGSDFALPDLTLSDSRGVLSSSVSEVRQTRALKSEGRDGQSQSAALSFTKEDYEQIRLAFSAFADPETQLLPVAALGDVVLSLGIELEDDRLRGLLERLGAEDDDDVTYAEFVDIVVVISSGNL